MFSALPWELDPEWKLTTEGASDLEKSVIEVGVPKDRSGSANLSGGKK